jgi:GDP-L-fucose synthase
MLMNKSAKIYISGYRGMVGSAIQHKFNPEGYNNIIHRTSSELDLLNQNAVNAFWISKA